MAEKESKTKKEKSKVDKKAEHIVKPENKANVGKKSKVEDVATQPEKPLDENKQALVALTGDDPFKVLKFVLMTEKAVQVIEKQNKLVFIVDRGSDKSSIKAAVETAFNAPVNGVQTMIDQEGRKKAFVKFRNAGAAGDIAIKLGII